MKVYWTHSAIRDLQADVVSVEPFTDIRLDLTALWLESAE